MRNITKEINVFREFLLRNWGFFSFFNDTNRDSLEEEERLENWLEANWEIIVECEICTPNETLQHYGNGADMGMSSKIFSFRTNYSMIRCESKEGLLFDYLSTSNVDVNGYNFYQFVTKSGPNYYKSRAPFDYALLDKDGQEIMVEFDKLIYWIM